MIAIAHSQSTDGARRVVAPAEPTAPTSAPGENLARAAHDVAAEPDARAAVDMFRQACAIALESIRQNAAIACAVLERLPRGAVLVRAVNELGAALAEGIAAEVTGAREQGTPLDAGLTLPTEFVHGGSATPGPGPVTSGLSPGRASTASRPDAMAARDPARMGDCMPGPRVPERVSGAVTASITSAHNAHGIASVQGLARPRDAGSHERGWHEQATRRGSGAGDAALERVLGNLAREQLYDAALGRLRARLTAAAGAGVASQAGASHTAASTAPIGPQGGAT